jgi:hypothetical protein
MVLTVMKVTNRKMNELVKLGRDVMGIGLVDHGNRYNTY